MVQQHTIAVVVVIVVVIEVVELVRSPAAHPLDSAANAFYPKRLLRRLVVIHDAPHSVH
jgi:hypothetical protein